LFFAWRIVPRLGARFGFALTIVLLAYMTARNVPLRLFDGLRPSGAAAAPGS
jgi:hypothetical protein